MWSIFKKNEVQEKFNSQILVDMLIQYFTNIKKSSTDEQINECIDKIIKGLQLRLKIIKGLIVYDQSVSSIVHKVQAMTDEEKDYFNRCFYYIDKIFYKIDWK